MKLLGVTSQNIYSFADLNLGFVYSGGVTLVLGKNLDQKTANGAGKTSILKTIYFLIYGKDLNKAVKADIPNRAGNGSYYGQISFEDNGHHFKIERFAKRKDLHPNKTDKEAINFYIDHKLFMGPSLNHEPTEVQDAILNKVKMSPKLFESSILSKQNNRMPFLVANDTDKKEILAEILDLTSYIKAFEATKKEVAAIEERKSVKLNRISSLNDNISLLNDQIKEQTLSLNNFTISIQKEVGIEKDKILKIKKTLVELKALLVKTEAPNPLKEKLTKGIERIKELEAVLKDEVKLATQVNTHENELKSLSKELKELESKIDGYKKSNDKFELEFKEESNAKMTVESKEQVKKIVNLLNKSQDQKHIIDNQFLLSERLTEINQIVNHQEIINQEKKHILETIKENEMTIDRNKFSAQSIQKQIDDLSSSTTCPTCERDFDETHRKAHIQPKIDALVFEKKSYEAKELVMVNQLKDNNKKLLAINERLAEIEANQIIKDQSELVLSVLSQFNDKVQEKITFNINKNLELKGLEEQLSLLIKSKNDKEESLKLSKLEYEKINPLKQELESLRIEQSELDKKIKSIEVQQQSNNLNSEKMKGLVDNWKAIEENIKIIEAKQNPHQEIIEGINKKISSIQANVANFMKSISGDDDELKYLKIWLLGFSPTGIRSFIADDLIEVLNRKVQENLNDLFDGALSVLFEPESENNKGVSVNKISTKYYLNGRVVSEESLSGGQIQRCILATDLALTEVAESRSGNKLNVKFLDEPFTGIDSSGQQQAFRLFNKLAKEKDGFFVISHDENFQSMCANTIHILYKNETSRIVSKEEFDQHEITQDTKSTENSFKSKDADFASYLKEIARKKK